MLLPARSGRGVFVVCVMAAACRGEKVTPVPSSSVTRSPKSDVLAEKHISNASGCGCPGGTRRGGGRKVEGGSRGGEARLHSLLASQVNNCTTSRQTKELAQLLTQGRWESRQHKTTREGADLLVGPESRAGGVLSSSHKPCPNPSPLPRPSSQGRWGRLPLPKEKAALNSPR